MKNTVKQMKHDRAGTSRVISLAVAAALAVASFGAPAMAQDGDVVRIALSGGVDRLDPTKTASGTDLAVATQIYETLLKIDPETGELAPNLAESYEALSPTVWQIRLREGVQFHDGTPLTAADVEYSVNRVLDEEFGSPHRSQLKSIREVRVIDDLTVEIETEGPNPIIMRRMQPVGGSGRVFIVSKDYFESRSDEDLMTMPMGTGPYRLESWEQGSSITLSRNEDYWGEAPDIETGVFTFIPENSTRVNALLQGEVDVIQRLPIIDVERVDAQVGTKVVASPNGLVHTLMIDSTKPPFDDINVRKALAHALDTETMVKALLGDYGRTLGVPVGPSVVQYDDSIEPYTYDPDMSRDLLEGKTLGVLETLMSNGRYVNDQDFYQVINSQLEAVGFEIEAQTLEWGRLVGLMLEANAGPFYIVGWNFGEGDASKMDSFLRSTSSISVTEDAEYDRLSEAAASESDPATRTELWKQAQQRVHDQYYIAAVWQASALYGFSEDLDWTPHFGENLFLSEIEHTAE